jgi:hypothetical protein
VDLLDEEVSSDLYKGFVRALTKCYVTDHHYRVTILMMIITSFSVLKSGALKSLNCSIGRTAKIVGCSESTVKRYRFD